MIFLGTDYKQFLQSLSICINAIIKVTSIINTLYFEINKMFLKIENTNKLLFN